MNETEERLSLKEDMKRSREEKEDVQLSTGSEIPYHCSGLCVLSLQKKFMLSFPTRPVTVDCVIFQGEGVVLIRRGHDPFKGYYALPGGFVDVNETVEEACRREALEETGVQVAALRLIGVYSDPSRDPDRHTVAIAFLAEGDISSMKAGDDASHVELVSDWRNVPLAFDHRRIIEDAWRMRHPER
jgi:8-oxo-dGTP diphosphatase